MAAVAAQLSAKANSPEVVAKVQAVISAADAQACDFIEATGREIIKATGEIAGKYLVLVNYIRSHKVGPKLVTDTLLKLGFKKTRVSEINRVAQASDEVFSKYQARAIGFDKALEMARKVDKDGKVIAEPTPALKLLADAHQIGQSEYDEAVDEVAASGGKKPVRKSSGQLLKAHALAMVKLAADNNLKPGKFAFKEYAGWVVTLEKA